MKRTLTAYAVLALSLLTAAAHAQPSEALPPPSETESEANSTAAPPPAPTAKVAAPAAEPSQPGAAPAQAGVACVTDNFGLDPDSARTAGQIVCDEIRACGVALLPQGVPGAETYRVSFERLGDQLIARLSYEAPTGSVVRSRRLVLGGPAEIVVAGPRLANAVVLDRPLEEGQRVDNLVSEETRRYQKKSGEFLWGVGLGGVALPFAGVVPKGALEAHGYYETPRLAFGFTGRVAVGDNSRDDKSFSYAGLGLGARYFFSETNTSPFVGGGFALSYVDFDDGDFSGSGGGLGAYAEVGAEFLRLHESRLVVSLRVEAPFYSVQEQFTYDLNDSDRTQYHVPAILSLAYMW